MIGAFLHLAKILFMVPFLVIKHRLLYPHSPSEEIKNIGIFHIPCHIHGGGEKVLWAMVDSLVRAEYNVTVYCTIIEDKELLLKQVKANFGYDISLSKFRILEIDSAYLAYGTDWPGPTKYLRAITQLAVAFDVLEKDMPDLFIESWSAHFSVLAVKLLNPHISIYTYLHFVWRDKYYMDGYYNEWNEIGASLYKIKLFLEIVYNYLQTMLFRYLTNFIDVCIANSTHTKDLLEEMWGRGKCITLYPPCNIEGLLEEDFTKKTRTVISVSQFRWEKRQELQLEAIAYHQKMHPDSTFKFKIMGNSKVHESDLVFAGLQKKLKELGLKNTELIRDSSIEQLRHHVSTASIGMHTLHREPFGISIAEMLAGGIYILAHNSAGPRSDILGHGGEPLYGELYDGYDEFYVKLNKIIENFDDPVKRAEMQNKVRAGQKNARDNLSNEAFSRNLIAIVKKTDKELKVKYEMSRPQGQAKSTTQKGKKPSKEDL